MPDWLNWVLLCGSALLAGLVNSVAGGGTLLTFPVLRGVILAATGDGLMAGVYANATSTMALLPGSLGGAWGYRREVRESKRALIRLLPSSLVGGFIGAWLAIEYPSGFNALVPWLILGATLLMVLKKPLQRWFTSEHGRPTWRTVSAIVVAQLLISLYGGYFGAGIGILMLGTLGFMAVGDIHRINAVKTVLASVINLASVILFAASAVILWKYVIAMAPASILGGYLGAKYARKMQPSLIQGIVIVIGFSLAAYYFVRQIWEA
jgi:uncharacterized protein